MIQLLNPVSGLMVQAKECACCSQQFAPAYTEWCGPRCVSCTFCRECLNNGTAYRLMKGVAR